MRTMFRKAILSVTLILVFPIISSAWEEEILKGIYAYQSKNLSIRFVWGDDGVERLRINGVTYPKAKYDNLGVFGNAALIEVRAEEKRGTLKVIHLLFFCNELRPLLISGYYADIREIEEDGSFKVASMKAIEMRYQPRPRRAR